MSEKQKTAKNKVKVGQKQSDLMADIKRLATDIMRRFMTQMRQILQRLEAVAVRENIEKRRIWLKQWRFEKLKSVVQAQDGKQMVLTIKSFAGHVQEKLRKSVHYVSDFWKVAIGCVGVFVFCYYILGGWLVEKIDVHTECPIASSDITSFQTPDCMSFLIKREVDEKMWTPNLPVIFPAYALDNMPHFQMGMVAAVKDVTSVMRKFSHNSEIQQKDIQKAYRLLSYSPRVWLMSRTGAFSVAPSSNAQYRKAARELRKYAKDGDADFVPEDVDLSAFLGKIRHTLLKLVIKNEEQQRESSSNLTDTKADDLFYFAKGYAFALGQICRVAGSDFKKIILQKDLYVDWTYMVSSLKKAAEFNPLIVRNGNISSLTAPNHLLIQNYYLQRAAVAVEKMRYTMIEGCYEH